MTKEYLLQQIKQDNDFVKYLRSIYLTSNNKELIKEVAELTKQIIEINKKELSTI